MSGKAASKLKYRDVLVHGENLTILKKLVGENQNGIFDLIYLDPPFFTQRTHKLLGSSANAGKVGFYDIWEKGRDSEEIGELSKLDGVLGSLLQTLRQTNLTQSELTFLTHIALRVAYCRKLLKPTGSLFVHCDPRMSHYIKISGDCIFGRNNFRNEIIWHYLTGGLGKRYFANKHDIILWYSKELTSYKFFPSRIREPRSEKALQRAKNARGARISSDNIVKHPSDVWEIPALNPMANERLGYPTQKPEALLKRIILACTESNDLVGDFYCGSGTTCKVASLLGRHWFGVDESAAAIEIASQRLSVGFESN